MNLDELRERPEKLWIDYIIERLIQERIINSSDDFEFRDCKADEDKDFKQFENPRALSYSFDFPTYYLCVEIFYSQGKKSFLKEYVHIEHRETYDSYHLVINGDTATYGLSSVKGLQLASQGILGCDPEKELSGRLMIGAELELAKLAGDGLTVQTKSMLDKFLEFLIIDYQSNP